MFAGVITQAKKQSSLLDSKDYESTTTTQIKALLLNTKFSLQKILKDWKSVGFYSLGHWKGEKKGRRPIEQQSLVFTW